MTKFDNRKMYKTMKIVKNVDSCIQAVYDIFINIRLGSYRKKEREIIL